MFKILFQHLRGTLTTSFERYLAVANESRYVQILFWLSIMKQKWAQVTRKLSVVEIYEYKNLLCEEHFTSYSVLLFLSNRPSF